MPDPHGTAESDQDAAHIRDLHQASGAGVVFLSRAELEQLIEDGATPADINAWMLRQIDAREIELATLNDLDPDKEN